MSTNTIHVGITGIGHEVGEIIVTNDDVTKIVENAICSKKERVLGTRELTKEEKGKYLCDPEWLVNHEFFGRVHTAHTTVDLGVAAAKKAIEMSGCRKQNIQALLFGTVSPNRNYSPTCAQLATGELGLQVRNELGLKNFLPSDMQNTCTTIGSVITLGWCLIKAGFVKHLLVIGADKMSITVDPADRNFYPLMGDAGTAIIMEAVTESSDSFPWQEKSFFSVVEPSGVNNIIAKAGGSAMPLTPEMIIGSPENPLALRPDKLWQDGKKVHGHMIRFLSDPTVPPRQTVFGAALHQVGLTLQKIDAIYPHQASVRMNKEALINLKQKGFKGRMSDNGKRYGNTTSAAVLLGASLDSEQGILQTGQTIALAPFGAGYTACIIFVNWTANIP
ncbi:MAG: 3-oxoacyl-[acyl-carrier-protein] synthase III C-terminal domain-containing protein [Patescibacteria group bacterium]